MSGVKANWYVDLSGVDETDPFGESPQVRIEEVGRKVDLEDPNARLLALLNQESKLFNAGLVCPIKDHAESSCAACPIRHLDQLDPMKALCDVGVEQDILLTLSVIRRAAPEALAEAPLSH